MQGLILNDKKSSVSINKEYLAARVERLLFTEVGHILGYPDYGSRLNEFLHEQLDDTTAEDIINEITFLFQTYEPDIEIEDILVDILYSESSQTGIVIKMNLYIIETGEVQEITIPKIFES
jgi:phage baseplate assembly protein W